MRGHIVWSVLVVVGCGDNLVGNRAPEIPGALVTTAEDTAVTYTVAVRDPEADVVSLRASTPEHGAVAIDGDRITYTPAPNFHGSDSVLVTASDGSLESNATIDITVTSVNDPPVGGADSFAGAEDTPLAVAVATLLANDSDADGDALTVVSVGNPAHGAVTIAGADVRFTPTADFTGNAGFEYVLSDGTTATTVAVAIAVGLTNDPPVAVDDAITATEDTPRTVTAASLVANDLDPDVPTQILSVTAVGNPTNGTVVLAGGDVTFTPAADFAGTATFEYTVSDGVLDDVGVVAIAVAPVDDAPIAVDDTATTPEDTALDLPEAALVGNDTDIDGPGVAVIAAGNPTGGTVTLSGGVVTFTPAADFAGTATFEYTVSDGSFTDVGAVAVTVTAVDDPPIAVDDIATTAEDTPLGLTAAALVANDTDVDGPGLTVVAVGNPVNGAVVLSGGTATFTPASEFSGTATFEYTVSDGTLTDVGVVTIAVTPENDAPVAVDDTATTAEDTALAIPVATLAANDTDVDGPSLTVTAAGAATNGSVALSGSTITFTPASNFAGTATFEYTVSDSLATDTGLVTVTVTPDNDPPVATDDAVAMQRDGSLAIPHAALLANDTDLDGPGLTITSVQDPTDGAVTLGASTVTFTPDPGFTGVATFEYVVGDGTATDVGLVAVTVTAAPVCGDGRISAPEICDDGGATDGDGCSAACQVEAGYECTGQPSACTPICGDAITIPPEQCDDGNPVNEDGCTTACVTGVVCTAAAFPGGDRFAVDPNTGHCYVSFDDDQHAFADAEAACVGVGGYLATITSAPEDAVVHAVHNAAQNPWIGAVDDANDTDAVFDWVTDESFGFTHYAAGQPDDDAGSDGNGECLHLVDPASEWADTSCTATGLVVGRICELEPVPCGDSISQLFEGEECDDGNTTSGDGCSATCQLEDGCGDGNLDPGEQCDDDNTVSGDHCSATCQLELVAIAIHPGPVAIHQHQRVQLDAIGVFGDATTIDVTAIAGWSSTDPAIAIVGTAGINNGRVDGLVAIGSTAISATVGATTGSTDVTVDATTCSIRVNEVQTAGDGTVPAADEFVELVNPCTFAVDVTGWNLVYRSAAGTSDITATTVPLLGVMAPGSFRLYVGTGFNGGGSPDGVIGASPTGSYAAAGGGVAIRSGLQDVGAIVDSVGWGTAANAYVEGAAPAPPAANRSIYRAPFDGRDRDANAVDFLVTDPATAPPTVPTPGSTNRP